MKDNLPSSMLFTYLYYHVLHVQATTEKGSEFDANQQKAGGSVVDKVDEKARKVASGKLTVSLVLVIFKMISLG